MRVRAAAAMAMVFAGVAAAQKVSPRLREASGQTYVVVFRPGTDMAHARESVSEKGFQLVEHPDLRPNHLLAAGPRSRVRQLGDLDDVTYIFPASPELTARQRVIACGGAIGPARGAAADYVLVGRGWPGDASGAVALHYAFQSLTDKLDPALARAEIERAFREWQSHANLSLAESSDPQAPRTIAISFSRGAHGDGYPFDGSGSMLAHTFYPAPPNPEPVAGDMHFDADENWRIGATVDLFSVALHEAGHALGLGHSDVPGSVMYPYYRQAYGLTEDDIEGIQHLYGAPATTQPETPAPPPPATPSTPVPDPPKQPVQPPSPPTAQPPAPPTSGATDRTPPSLRIVSPAATIVGTKAAAITVSGAASDDTGVSEVKWATSTGDSGVASGTAQWSFSAPLCVGTTVVTIRAYDAAGNASWRAITVTRH